METHFVGSIAEPALDSALPADDVSITCFDREIPKFAEAEMDRLYGNIFSSMTQFLISGLRPRQTSTYVARNRQRVLALLLFERTAHGLKVLNECIRLDEREIRRFVDYIFDRFPDVKTVAFNAVEIDQPRLPFPFQHYNMLEDVAMKLPETAQEYLAGLGKNTRRNVKRYGERIQRTFPDFAFEVYEREDVTEQMVREIISFNHARMIVKNKRSNLDEASVQRITRMAHACGLVGVARIDGRICAGAISYRAGNNYFLDVLAHDPAYDDYWIGILCCYRTICECIEHGGREFHFLWGRYDYKFTLGASVRDLDTLVVYRSSFQMLRNAPLALRTLYNGKMRQLKLWMDEQAVQPSAGAAGVAFRMLRALQQVKRNALQTFG